MYIKTVLKQPWYNLTQKAGFQKFEKNKSGNFVQLDPVNL